MSRIIEHLLSTLARRRSLRSQAGNFDERARLQSEIPGARAAIAAQSRRLFPS